MPRPTNATPASRLCSRAYLNGIKAAHQNVAASSLTRTHTHTRRCLFHFLFTLQQRNSGLCVYSVVSTLLWCRHTKVGRVSCGDSSLLYLLFCVFVASWLFSVLIFIFVLFFIINNKITALTAYRLPHPLPIWSVLRVCVPFRCVPLSWVGLHALHSGRRVRCRVLFVCLYISVRL